MFKPHALASTIEDYLRGEENNRSCFMKTFLASRAVCVAISFNPSCIRPIDMRSVRTVCFPKVRILLLCSCRNPLCFSHCFLASPLIDPTIEFHRFESLPDTALWKQIKKKSEIAISAVINVVSKYDIDDQI